MLSRDILGDSLTGEGNAVSPLLLSFPGPSIFLLNLSSQLAKVKIPRVRLRKACRPAQHYWHMILSAPRGWLEMLKGRQGYLDIALHPTVSKVWK
jgi:hypothetical protein